MTKKCYIDFSVLRMGTNLISNIILISSICESRKLNFIESRVILFVT